MKSKRFYIYVHKKLTNGDVFYVGKGTGDRAKSKSGRNRWWWNIANKHGYYHEIIIDNLTSQEADKLEIEKIRFYRENGNICNVANGGDSGLTGIPLSIGHKEKLRNAKIGKKQNPEHAKKSAIAKLGKKQPRDAVEKMVAVKRKKVINSDGEIFSSATEAADVMSKRLGVKASQGNISMCCRGERGWAYGLSWSYNITSKPNPPKLESSQSKRIYCSNGMSFDSVQDAKDWVKSWRGKANNQTLSSCARGDLKTAYGFNWRY